MVTAGGVDRAGLDLAAGVDTPDEEELPAMTSCWAGDIALGNADARATGEALSKDRNYDCYCLLPVRTFEARKQAT